MEKSPAKSVIKNSGHPFVGLTAILSLALIVDKSCWILFSFL